MAHDIIPASRGLPRIVIVGGGAGGLELAVRLGNRAGRKALADIVLVDSDRTHLWKPLLHQVAAGTLDSHVDEQEYFALARAHHFQFRLGRMDGLDRSRKQLKLAPTLAEDGSELLPRQTLDYDILVIAIGSQTNDFGTPGVAAHCIMLDTPAAAECFHQRLINYCIRQTASDAEHDAPFTVTIIGGGATGVELSAELHMTTEILGSYGMANFHPERDLKIVVVDAAPRLLQMLPEKLSDAVARELQQMDIEIHTAEKVVEITEQGVRMASGGFIRSNIVVWAAGIKIPDFIADLDGLETNKINQLVVRRTLQTTRDPGVFAFGDCAQCPQDPGQPNVPPRAQAAHQQAVLLSKSLMRSLRGKPLLEFTYRDYGSLVALGDETTVGTLMGAISRGSVFVEGTFARWMYWWLHKRHQIAVNGWMHTLLLTLAESLARASQPRIKLH